MPWTLFDTTLGRCGLAWSAVGLTSMQLPEATPEQTKERLLARTPRTSEAGARATPRTTPAWVARAIELVRAHLDGQPQDFTPVPLDFGSIPPFSARVYRALQAVPAGSTVSYGDLARAAASPGASRAVGRAMATNPFPIFVPCHRVLASGGKAGGFSAYGGVLTKNKILAIEGFADPTETAGGRQTSLFGVPSGRQPQPASDASRQRGLPYDGAAAVTHLTTTDTVLAAHVARIGAFTLSLKQTEGTFAGLAESIVYQQLNGKAALTIFERVRALFPKARLDPTLLLGMSDEALRGAGLSRSKLAALRDLSERAASGRIPTLAELGRLDDAAIIEKLTEVRGIGRWTVEMLLIFRLGRPDVLPVADYGVKKGFARLFHRGKRKDELPTDADLLRRGERWRPFRSVASWYLWRATDT